VKKILLVFAVAVLLLPVAAQAKFTLGEAGKRSLSLFGSMKAGFDYDLEAGENDPAMSFDYSYISLFVGGNLTPEVTYLFNHTFDKGVYRLLDCWMQWNPARYFLVRAGQFKAPFGRFYNSSGARLIFKTRNPITCHCPKYQVGVMPGVRFAGNRYELNVGVFDGEGLNTFNVDPHFMYAANVVIAPLGPVPMHESGHPGFDDPLFAVVPGVFMNTVQTPVMDTMGQVIRYEDVATTSYGAALAFRYDYLALDGGYYMKTVDDPTTDGTVNSSGLSVQTGYAVMGRYEPVLRFSMLDPNSDHEGDEVTTIEAGFNWYFRSYSSRLGLNYMTEMMADDKDETTKSVVKLYYMFLF
jgi:hypothetical protein